MLLVRQITGKTSWGGGKRTFCMKLKGGTGTANSGCSCWSEGTSLFCRNPQQMFQSMAVPVWGKEKTSSFPGARRQAIAENTSSLLFSKCLIPSKPLVPLPGVPLLLEGAASCSAWKPAFYFPDLTHFIASPNPALMPGIPQVSSLLSEGIYGAQPQAHSLLLCQAEAANS